eukprot:CCRYP_016875-RB/>CCRYP_016875-RB protein AED:0.01 eAED:0.01 QI:389/1/1/1/0.5/0.33/3/416/811
MASTPRSSPRGSPITVPNASPKSTSSAASFLTSITRCLDSARSVDNDVLDDVDDDASRPNLKWGPSGSFDDSHCQPNFNSSILLRPLTLKSKLLQASPKASPEAPNKQHQPQHSSSSHSNRTDPTAPITTSTQHKSLQQQQKQLSLKTGMSMNSPSTPSNSLHNNNNSSHCHTTTTASDRATTLGSGSHFWNFHVRSADSTESGSHGHHRALFAEAQRHDRDYENSHALPATNVSALNNSQSSHPNSSNDNNNHKNNNENNKSDNESTVSPKSSPTSLLLSQSAKAAAEAAASILTMMESISTQVGTHVAKATDRYVNMGGVSAVAFCGSPRGSPRASPSPEDEEEAEARKRMEGIPEEDHYVVAENNNNNGDSNNHNDMEDAWDTYFCVNKNDCTFQEFDYNAFRESKDKDSVGNKDDLNQESYSKSLPSNQEHRSLHHNNTAATEEPDPKGYEIRLKSTFSQQQMKTQRQRDAFPNLPEKDNRGCTMLPPTSSATPSAFGRTHPNTTLQKLPQHQQPTPNHHVYTPSSTAAAPSAQTLPLEYLSIPKAETNNNDTNSNIERTTSEVSELTMRSHSERYHRYSSDSRRMAYYAVGKIDENDDGRGSGGNRRCYFTGIVIQYGIPFYAGSVQQGPRTLVVFCHPSALGLPSLQLHPLNNYSKADRDRYLQSLPEPDAKLLEEMKRRFPDPFDTLPVQVRSPNYWRLFVKFCYFSGLPIAEGEMHYQVKSSVIAFRSNINISKDPTNQNKQEEISLSHEVMEAVNGEESAEILRLPNQKTFDYLRRQYSQQSAKLNDEVFDRKSWVRVRAEV